MPFPLLFSVRYNTPMPNAKLQNFTVHFHNSEEYHHLKREIFSHNTYYFETTSPNPTIIDAGAHIGLATLYFKTQYPLATITAVEPNPYLFALLEQNIFENQLQDIICINAALAATKDKLPFYIDETANQWWSTGSFINGAWTKQQKSTEILVPTIPLSDIVTTQVDLLKLDIEGAEQLVLESCPNVLHFIDQIHIEYHSTKNQSMVKLSELLTNHGFVLTYFKDGYQLEKFNINQPKGLFEIHAKKKAQKSGTLA